MRVISVPLLVASVGCGAASPPPAEPLLSAAPPAARVVAKTEAAPVAAASLETAPSPATTRKVPTTCADPSACVPPSAFVDAVCKRKFADLPLYLFANKLPWKHLYVKAEYVEPVNPYGGEQSEAWLKFGEEVILLRRHAQGGGKGVQISGPSDIDVLRWDGTCATVREEMFVTYVTAPLPGPRIIWKYLDQGSQDALLTNGVVARAREAEKKGCRDSSPTHPTPACDKAMQKLTDAIALAVHLNIELPGTGSLPDWAE